MLCRHWYREDISIKDLALRCLRLPAIAFLHKIFGFELVKIGEPLTWIRNDRLEQDPLPQSSNPYFVALETEFPWETNCLTASVTKKLRGFGFRHSSDPR